MFRMVLATAIVGGLLTASISAEERSAAGHQADVCGFPVRDVTLRAGEGADASRIEPLAAGSVRHFANLYESPFDVFAICTRAMMGQEEKTIQLPRNTKDCYFAGGRLECSYLAEDEMVPVE